MKHTVKVINTNDMITVHEIKLGEWGDYVRSVLDGMGVYKLDNKVHWTEITRDNNMYYKTRHGLIKQVYNYAQYTKCDKLVLTYIDSKGRHVARMTDIIKPTAKGAE